MDKADVHVHQGFGRAAEVGPKHRTPHLELQQQLRLPGTTRGSTMPTLLPVCGTIKGVCNALASRADRLSCGRAWTALHYRFKLSGHTGKR